MLKELGITHVVSVGESALIPPPQMPTPTRATAGGAPVSAALKARMPTNSLWLEERLGTMQVLDLRGVADDGIDSIRDTLDHACEFIQQAEDAGGRVLVHCRVGVSRSSTVVIAYLMRRHEMDLASAYLLCRSRRLNILIQVRGRPSELD